MELCELRKINDHEWEIPASYRENMKVPVRIFGTRQILERIRDDRSLEQAVNSATLPGLVGAVYVMPDMHQGYGFPIGGVAATKYPEGVISPGAIGYDINCGVRLMSSDVEYEAAEDQLDHLADALEYHTPSGVGVGGRHGVDIDELERVAAEGARWALDKGLARSEDLELTEEKGSMDRAHPDFVSRRALKRGTSQIGTLGAGNHFLELQVVDEIFDPEAAEAMGIKPNRLALLIHTGSRGFGHQICTDYVQKFQQSLSKHGIDLPDSQLVCAPMDSEEGRQYLTSMRCAANYAFANRQVLASEARLAFEKVLARHVDNWDLHQVYDIAHNMGKVENHIVDGTKVRVCVHRKGATRAFGPGHPDLPEKYKSVGQPVFVPGSMGTASWVLTGTKDSMSRSFGSSCHGAGRTMSRTQAKKSVWGEDLIQSLEARDIRVRANSLSGLAEEAPTAYKDVDGVIDSVEHASIANKVARLKPVAVIKG